MKCEHCGESGLVTVFHPDYEGNSIMEFIDGDRGRFTVAARVAAHCVCPRGRTMRDLTKDPKVLDRIPDFAYVLAGQSLWVADDPTPDRPGPTRVNRKAVVQRVSFDIPPDVHDDPVIARELASRRGQTEPAAY